jgi:hypothetical protein
MTPLSDLARRLRNALPNAAVDFAEPVNPDGVGFLDVSCGDTVLAVQWHKNWHFGVSSPEGHGYGEPPDEAYDSVEATATRIIELVRSGGRTVPPAEVTLRELRAEKRLPQTGLAALLGVSQPAVSKLERHVSRMMVSTLRSVIKAMGGTLILQARFPDGHVRQIAIDDDSTDSAEPLAKSLRP